MQTEEVVQRCCAFIRGIGLEVMDGEVGTQTFVPGITIRGGKIIIDRSKLQYPGDLLHEAGHIALIPSEERSKINGDVTGSSGEYKGYEMGVLSWSYLAARATGIPPEVVFHEGGYKGDSEWLLENFRNEKFIGLPLLEWMGIARKTNANRVEIIRWMRA